MSNADARSGCNIEPDTMVLLLHITHLEYERLLPGVAAVKRHVAACKRGHVVHPAGARARCFAVLCCVRQRSSISTTPRAANTLFYVITRMGVESYVLVDAAQSY